MPPMEAHRVTDQPDSLVLATLHRIDGKLDRLTDEVVDLKRRMTSLESSVALLHGDFAGQSARIDRIEIRLDRIERRLDLVPGDA